MSEKYCLVVETGYYESPTLLSLFLEVMRHRWSHFLNGEGFTD